MTKNTKPEYKLVKKDSDFFIPKEDRDEHLKSKGLGKAADLKFIVEPKKKTTIQ